MASNNQRSSDCFSTYAMRFNKQRWILNILIIRCDQTPKKLADKYKPSNSGDHVEDTARMFVTILNPIMTSTGGPTCSCLAMRKEDVKDWKVIFAHCQMPNIFLILKKPAGLGSLYLFFASAHLHAGMFDYHIPDYQFYWISDAWATSQSMHIQ